MQFIDSKVAFEEAITRGILSDDGNTLNYAGNFMYMETKEGVHQFKNIITRKYGSDLPSIMQSNRF
ncbi:MAG: hypothetical protein ACJAVG_000494 [Rickettsiales bacterium]|jgi:hypothetical protein